MKNHSRHSIWIGLILTGFMLSGCFPAAFVAGGAATEAVLTEPRSLGTIKEDETISYQINKQLAKDSDLSNQAHVTATVYNHIILLTGQVRAESLRQQATRYAEAIPKVNHVFNQITLSALTSSWQRGKDVGITSAARARLLAAKGLRSNQFKLVTENGSVFILGIASQRQAALATAVVQGTLGVQKVVRLIEIVQA